MDRMEMVSDHYLYEYYEQNTLLEHVYTHTHEVTHFFPNKCDCNKFFSLFYFFFHMLCPHFQNEAWPPHVMSFILIHDPFLSFDDSRFIHIHFFCLFVCSYICKMFRFRFHYHIHHGHFILPQ